MEIDNIKKGSIHMISKVLLEQIHKRAPMYDLNNEFPILDYEGLKKEGYYKALVPKSLGGLGLSLKEVAREQIRLAEKGPATALGINMHQIITGVGAYLYKRGFSKGKDILDAAVQGELMAFGISEPSNDKVLFGSTSSAIPQTDGSYVFEGRKIFISMAKQFDRLLTFAQDNTSSEAPLSVYAFVKRNDQMKISGIWDTLGMRGTQSFSIHLDQMSVSKADILEKLKPGPTKHPLILSIFAYFEILLAATYHGIGKRALEIGIETVKHRKSVALGKTYSQDKDIRWRIAEGAILLDGINVQIETLADMIENDIDDPYIFQKLSTIKNKSVETTRKVVEEMIRASGGRSYENKEELSRLYRDALAGLFQPSDQESLHNAWANALLGPLER